MNDMGKLLIIIGIISVIIGLVFIFGGKFLSQIPFGRLPGDINIKKDNFSFHFPIVSSIIISIILTIILNIFFRK
jgi:hypothetical protein